MPNPCVQIQQKIHSECNFRYGGTTQPEGNYVECNDILSEVALGCRIHILRLYHWFDAARLVMGKEWESSLRTYNMLGESKILLCGVANRNTHILPISGGWNNHYRANPSLQLDMAQRWFENSLHPTIFKNFYPPFRGRVDTFLLRKLEYPKICVRSSLLARSASW